MCRGALAAVYPEAAKQKAGKHNTVAWDVFRYFEEPQVWIHQATGTDVAAALTELEGMAAQPIVFVHKLYLLEGHSPAVDAARQRAAARSALHRACPALQTAA